MSLPLRHLQLASLDIKALSSLTKSHLLVVIKVLVNHNKALARHIKALVSQIKALANLALKHLLVTLKHLLV